MLMHPEYGLWHAYRVAIALPETVLTQQPESTEQQHACDTCATQPCYSSCPVGAFANDHYDVDRCVSYLSETPQAQCNQTGCIARMSCPEAAQHRYSQSHAAFHIKQFVKARMAAKSNAGDK